MTDSLLDRVIDTTEHHEHEDICSEILNSLKAELPKPQSPIERQPPIVRVTARPVVSSRIATLIWTGGALAVLFWLLLILGVGKNPTPATTMQATPTPTPMVQKAEPHKAKRALRR